jgi:riboflavin biosynthesis pyrimidine reductase
MEPLKTLLDKSEEENILIPELMELYGGPLGFGKAPEGRPRVLINFVTDLAGLISFNEPGHMGGGDISMFNPQDTFIMGLLRAVADGVAVGANTLRLEPEHLWTPEFISKQHVRLYQGLRERLGKKTKNPVNIFVTGSGSVLTEGKTPRVFTEPDIETIVITTEQGKAVAERQFLDKGLKTEVLAFGSGKEVDLPVAMKVLRERGIKTLLVEGGPGFTDSLANTELVEPLASAGLCDEFFLTRAPQIIGNSKENPRPTFIMGTARHPENSIKVSLMSVKNWGDYLYERYKAI